MSFCCFVSGKHYLLVFFILSVYVNKSMSHFGTVGAVKMNDAPDPCCYNLDFF